MSQKQIALARYRPRENRFFNMDDEIASFDDCVPRTRRNYEIYFEHVTSICVHSHSIAYNFRLQETILQFHRMCLLSKLEQGYSHFKFYRVRHGSATKKERKIYVERKNKIFTIKASFSRKSASSKITSVHLTFIFANSKEA